MQLIINGESLETPQISTLADLSQWLDLPDFGSAIELNGNVVKKADYVNTPLRVGDKLEIIRLVGGG